MFDVVAIKKKFESVEGYWSPHIVGEVNDSLVKIAKFKGNFEWHTHAREDEMFFVVHGTITIKLRDKNLVLSEGEFTIVPKGVEHSPEAEKEAWVMMIEPRSTVNTGDNISSEYTKTELPSL